MGDQNVILKALGLVSAYNTLDTPPGTFAKASNVVIRKEGVVEKRRGFSTYGDNLGGSAKQLLTYHERILRHYGTVIDWDSDGEGSFIPFDGSYTEPQDTRIHSVNYNDNLFFTTNNGIKKLSAPSTDYLLLNGQDTGFIKDAGGAKALDLQVEVDVVDGSSSGWFLADSAVAYRYVIGYTDANNISVLGSVSQRIDIYNYLINLIQLDYNRLLNSLDNIVRTDSATSRLGQVLSFQDDYSSDTSSGSVLSTTSAVTLRNHVIALGTKLDDRMYIAQPAATTILATRQRTSTTSGTLVFNTSMVNYVSVGDKLISTTYSGLGNPNEWNNNILTVTNVSGVNVLITPTTNFTATDGAPVVDITAIIKRSKYSNTTLYPQPSVPSSNPTNAELIEIQDYIQSFITGLQSELVGLISSISGTTYLNILDVTSTATTTITAALPEGLDTNYYIQLYRSNSGNGQATGTTSLSNTTPLDELQLVSETYLTNTDITNGYIVIEDITPDSLLGALLYTNQQSGEGILQNNQPPPVAKDITLFKNYTFYANTRTKHRRTLTLVGVTQMIADYNNSIFPKLLITNSANQSQVYSFTLGKAQTTTITTIADSGDNFNGKYFLINSGENETEYYVWYKTSGGVATDPALSGKTGIRVNIQTNDTASEVARKTATTLQQYNTDFIVGSTVNPFTVTAVKVGYTTASNSGTMPVGFLTTTTIMGQGENVATNEILLASDGSISQNIDSTARSLTHVVNSNDNETIYADYLYDPTQPPGKIAFESRLLNDDTFYFLGNNANTGLSFFVDIGPLYVSNTLVTATTSIGTPTITTSAAHGLVDGDYVLLVNTGLANVDGYWKVDNSTSTTFQITSNAAATTSSGAILNTEDAVASSDEEQVNRLYYSKLQQPESVPLLNYVDLGAGNKSILRILGLSNSLFIFKEDGIYRLTSEGPPFTLDVFDPSSILIAPETVSLLNGFIYYWSRQGINRLSEAGLDLISQSIDDVIKEVSSNNYTNFKTATWGCGYESDNTYYLGTVNEESDTKAQITYRFSTLTNTWVTADTASTCAVVESDSDIMYIGASDIPYIEKERKDFDRTDYSDREYIYPLGQDKYDIHSKSIELSNLTNVNIDDVVVQQQTVTVYLFNQLLKQLDTDTSVPSTNYFSLLEMVAGDNPRTKLLDLATKLDSELTTGYSIAIQSLVNKNITNITAEMPSDITSALHGLQSGRVINITGSTTIPNIDGSHIVTVFDANTFTIDTNILNGASYSPGTCTFSTSDNDINDLQACYNSIVNKLNSDPLVGFTNYPLIENYTTLETLILTTDLVTNKITVPYVLDFLQGDLTIYNNINSDIRYNALTFGDPINYKQLRDLQLLFSNKAFTRAIIGFQTDLIPMILEHPFNGDGNGIFGLSAPFGQQFFGGNSHGAPYRTYIPRNYQRCRYIQIEFIHKVARETFKLFGTTITGNTQLKERAYR
jgi:hypothetical protein